MLSFFAANNYIFLAAFGLGAFLAMFLGNGATVLALVGLLVQLCCNREKLKARFSQLWQNECFKAYLIGVGAFFAATLLASVFSDNVVYSLKHWVNNWPWRFLMFLLPVLTVRQTEQAKKILYAIFGGLFLACSYMMYQNYVLGEFRPNGFYGHWMMNAGLICEVLPIVLVLFWYKQLKVLPRWLVLVLALVYLGGLLANNTRGAWLACGITFLLLVGLQIKKQPKLAVVMLLCCCCLGVGLAANAGIRQRVYSMTNMTTDYSNRLRLSIWKGAVDMYTDNPVLGVGEGQYRVKTIEKYHNPGMVEIFNHAHSVYLQILCISGTVGFAGLCLMFGNILYYSFKSYRLEDNPWYLAIFASTLCLLLQGVTEYNIGHSTITKMYWLLLGTLFVLAHEYGKQEQEVCEESSELAKTVLDYMLATMLLVLLSPVLLIIAILLKIDNQGSILYDGWRIGKNGKLFKCYKFRSMYGDSETALEQCFQEQEQKRLEWEKYHKLKEDPRLTPLGKFLRVTSLDELPQLFNVLQGDMSLVGPRPYLPSEREDMGEAYYTIIKAKPGITGYWQVNGRNNVAFKTRVEMDCWYMQNKSLELDLKLLGKTLGVVLSREGAK